MSEERNTTQPTAEEISAAMRVISRIRTEKKAAASRRNGHCPVKPGSRPRGWEKGKPRKPQGPMAMTEAGAEL